MFYALEDRFECWLLNAQHLHNVPGRKTDVADSAWICQMVEHGLVRPSFVPPPAIRRLRNLTRLHKAQTDERTRAVQRLEKVMQGCGDQADERRRAGLFEVSATMLEALLVGVCCSRLSWPFRVSLNDSMIWRSDLS